VRASLRSWPIGAEQILRMNSAHENSAR